MNLSSDFHEYKEDLVFYEKKKYVTGTINRPIISNYIDPETDYKLADSWAEFRDYNYFHVTIIGRACDKAFYTRADLNKQSSFIRKRRLLENEYYK